MTRPSMTHVQGRPRRPMWLCTACRLCRRHTSLRALEGRFWCAWCQQVTVFRPGQAMPQMSRSLTVQAAQEDAR